MCLLNSSQLITFFLIKMIFALEYVRKTDHMIYPTVKIIMRGIFLFLFFFILGFEYLKKKES